MIYFFYSCNTPFIFIQNLFNSQVSFIMTQYCESCPHLYSLLCLKKKKAKAFPCVCSYSTSVTDIFLRFQEKKVK